MTRLNAYAKLVEDFRIDVDDRRSHAICLDQERDTGTDMGPSALELCLMSHVGCYATIFVLTMQKMRLALKDLEVTAHAVKSQEVGTITEQTLEVSVRTDASMDRVQRAHEVTLKRCPVGILFDKAGVRTSYNLKVVKE